MTKWRYLMEEKIKACLGDKTDLPFTVEEIEDAGIAPWIGDCKRLMEVNFPNHVWPGGTIKIYSKCNEEIGWEILGVTLEECIVYQLIYNHDFSEEKIRSENYGVELNWAQIDKMVDYIRQFEW